MKGTMSKYKPSDFTMSFEVRIGCDIKRFDSTDGDVWLSALPTGASIHNRFLIKAKAEAGETYSKITENACVYKKFLNTKGI